MLSKVIVIVAVVAVAYAAPQHDQPARYPAGVNPALCPGFPICDNALLHGTAPVGGPAPQAWGAPQPNPWNLGAQSWNNIVAHAQPVNQWNQWDAQALHDPSNDISGPGGDRYPAGVNPSACPNYPYCDTGVSAASHLPQVAPLPGYTSRQYPAGVSPASCPNFPYCH